MNARVTITPEGHIAVPDDVLKRLAWKPGTALDMTEGGGVVTLRQPAKGSGGNFAAAVRRLRKAAGWSGPRYDDAEWKAAIDAKFREGGGD